MIVKITKAFTEELSLDNKIMIMKAIMIKSKALTETCLRRSKTLSFP